MWTQVTSIWSTNDYDSECYDHHEQKIFIKQNQA